MVATCVTATVASLLLALSTPASISVDGQRVSSDVAPVTTLGAAYLPLRAVAEASGATAAFDPVSGAVTVRRGTDVLVMHAGARAATLNGRGVTLTHAPFTVRGRTMVAETTVARTLGSVVRFDARRGRVDVRTPGVVVAPVGDDQP